MMRYLDICSGISAPTVGWRELGFTCAGYSEIEAAPRSVLIAQHGATAVDWDHRYTAGSNVTPLFGDFTKIEAHHVGPIDLLVGGTPCQSFSIAGLRGGMDDERGNLALEYLRLADRLRPRWLVWENVPGVLSSNGGRDFGSILGGMGELGYGFAYRVLDAQYFGVPQRRRRVFVVGYLGDWRRAAAVLFERHSLQGHSAPRREAGKGAATGINDGIVGSLCADSHPGAYSGQDAYTGRLIAAPTMAFKASHFTRGKDGAPSDVVPPLSADADKGDQDTLICAAPAVAYGFQPRIARNGRGDMGDVVAALSAQSGETGKGDAAPCVALSIPIAIQAGAVRENPESGPDGVGDPEAPMFTLDQASQHAVAFNENQQGVVWESDTVQALNKGGGKQGQGYAAVRQAWAVRRLTPRECERLQGFPDDFTLVANRGKPMADGPRYKALGNSMAVPVLRWIGERIVMVDAIAREESEEG